jgi:hypothetical protein
MGDMCGIQDGWRGGRIIHKNGFHTEVFFHMVFRKKSSEDLRDQRKNRLWFLNHTPVSLLFCHSNIFVSSLVYILHRDQNDKFAYNNDVYRIRAGRMVDHNFVQGLLDHTACSIESFHRNSVFPELKQGSQGKAPDDTIENKCEDMWSPLFLFHRLRHSCGGSSKGRMWGHLHIFHRNTIQLGDLCIYGGSEGIPTYSPFEPKRISSIF